jgi:hypothetical protein
MTHRTVWGGRPALLLLLLLLGALPPAAAAQVGPAPPSNPFCGFKAEDGAFTITME